MSKSRPSGKSKTKSKKKPAVPAYAHVFKDIKSLMIADSLIRRSVFAMVEEGVFFGICKYFNRSRLAFSFVDTIKAKALFYDLYEPKEKPFLYWFGKPCKRNLRKRLAALDRCYRIAVRRHNKGAA